MVSPLDYINLEIGGSNQPLDRDKFVSPLFAVPNKLSYKTSNLTEDYLLVERTNEKTGQPFSCAKAKTVK